MSKVIFLFQPTRGADADDQAMSKARNMRAFIEMGLGALSACASELNRLHASMKQLDQLIGTLPEGSTKIDLLDKRESICVEFLKAARSINDIGLLFKEQARNSSNAESNP